MISIPFIWAYAAAVPNRHFVGVLVNPIDGMTYLSKIAQGFEGSWLLHLNYTPEPHRGVFLYTFYLALGHLGRILGTDPVLIFHVVRLIGGMFMFITLYRLVSDWTDSVPQRRITWALSIIGAGFGWLALAFGQVTPDVLILPEAFPIQATYANAHFPWAIAAAAALAHLLFTRALVDPSPWPDTTAPTLALLTSTLLLVSISPFVLVPIGVGYIVLCGWLWVEEKKFPQQEVMWGSLVVLFALPLALYTYWAISPENPIFHAWMQQNSTPSPPIWHYLVAYGPILILALIGLYAYRHHLHAEDGFLIGWIVSSALLLYAPISLQRRFALGLIIPLSILAGRGLWRVLAAGVRPNLRLAVVLAAFTLFLPTTVLAIVLPLAGTRDTEQGFFFYVSQNEAQALKWLETRSGTDPVVLASPELSVFVPVYGSRVVYGHPFETINATDRANDVKRFFQGQDCDVLEREDVDYVIVGPRERSIDDFSEDCLPASRPVFTSPASEVLIYDVDR